jgi:hypothetical protein
MLQFYFLGCGLKWICLFDKDYLGSFYDFGVLAEFLRRHQFVLPLIQILSDFCNNPALILNGSSKDKFQKRALFSISIGQLTIH